MTKRTPYLEVEHVATIHLTPDGVALFDDANCGRCCMCEEKVEYLICVITRESPYADSEYPKHPAMNAFLLELRSEFGHNFEFPVCALHRERESFVRQ